MKKFNRRDFIRTNTAAIASTSLMGSFVERALAQNTNFKRCIIWYTPEGCTQRAYWPRSFGDLNINMGASINGLDIIRPDNINNWEVVGDAIDRNRSGNFIEDTSGAATYILQPLKKHEQDINLYSGFYNTGDEGQNDDHAKAVGGALTGGTPKQGSFDQVIGSRLGKGASSIYMPVYGAHVKGRGAADSYTSPARSVGGGTFGSSNWNPMDTYMQLFRNGIPDGANNTMTGYSPDYGRANFLEQAAAQIEAVKCLGGEQARHKMEVLLASFEKLEKEALANLDLSGSDPSVNVNFNVPNGWTNTNGNTTDTSKYWAKPENFGKLVDIAIDTTVAALALDRTRCSLMQFSGSGTLAVPALGQHYTHLNIPGFEARGNDQRHDHEMGHANGNKVKARRDHARIQRWYYGRLAYLTQRLKEIPDGAGTLFDSTLIIATSEFSTYDHRRENMPYMTIGHLDGSMKTGQHYNGRKGNNLRAHSELFLGWAHALGVNVSRFGKASNAYKPFL
ncbi:DUF1552 domain-containing protein [Marinagarivorans algicola]|uniref:DUF1552 domain-containing protein n=1 Tax=Marinagarivorans algicola TaxID=1513270 RepID=UPI0006B40DA7|nr:DUF1552 domain-containing protein [Marinagarivorans algicola]